MTGRSIASTALTVAILGTGVAAAQVRPQPGMGDPHVQSIAYVADQVVEIDSSPGYQVSIELGADEQIQSVVLGDSAGWQVTASKAGNHLFVKSLQAASETNMTVVTTVRTYAFTLGAFAGLSATMPYTVRFSYPRAPGSPPAGAPIPPPPTGPIRYVIGGVRPLRPSSVRDDGTHTYIDWPPGVDLPAVYVIDQGGRESLANGNMRGGIYVLDTVATRLVFRIDRLVATADRRPAREKRR